MGPSSCFESWRKAFILLDTVVNGVCLGCHVVSMVETKLSYKPSTQDPELRISELLGWANIGLSLMQIMLVFLLRAGTKNKVALHLQRWALLTIATSLAIYAVTVRLVRNGFLYAPVLGAGILFLFKNAEVLVVLFYIPTLLTGGGFTGLYRGLCSLTVEQSQKTINSIRAGKFVWPQQHPPPLVSGRRDAETTGLDNIILPISQPTTTDDDDGTLSSELIGAEPLPLPIFYIQSEEINGSNWKNLDEMMHEPSYHHLRTQNHFGQGTHDDAFHERVEFADDLHLHPSANQRDDELEDILGRVRREEQDLAETRQKRLVFERQRSEAEEVRRDQNNFKCGTSSCLADDKKPEGTRPLAREKDEDEMKDLTPFVRQVLGGKVDDDDEGLHEKLFHLFEAIQQNRLEVEQKERALLTHVQQVLWKLLKDKQRRNAKSN